MKQKDPALAQENGKILLKKMNKTQKIAQKLFLFSAKKEHTQYFQHNCEISILYTNFLKEEIGSIFLEFKVIKPIRAIKILGILKNFC